MSIVESILNLIKAAPWRVSHNPEYHEYILDHQEKQLFDEVKHLIQHNGYTAFFMDQPYKYTDIETYRYWVCENVLNRCPNDYKSKHYKKK